MKTEKKNTAKDKIINATIRSIYERGLNQLSIRSIAKQAGLKNQSNVMYYFATKRELLLHCIKEVFHKIMFTKKKAIRDDGTPQEKLEKVIEAMETFNLTQKKTGVVFTECWCLAMRDKKVRDLFSSMYQENRRIIENIIKEGKEQGVFADVREDIVATFILAYTSGMAYQTYTYLGKDLDDHYRFFESVVGQVLKKPGK